MVANSARREQKAGPKLQLSDIENRQQKVASGPLAMRKGMPNEGTRQLNRVATNIQQACCPAVFCLVNPWTRAALSARLINFHFNCVHA